MKVLVLGATGFIGLPVAQAFVRNGHEVLGQTRSENKKKSLIQDEIIPVIADPTDSSTWIAHLADVDAVIDCVGGGADIKTLSMQTFRAVEAAATKRFPGTPKPIYVWTSGTWIHGEDRLTLKSDSAPLTNPAELTAWRPEVETAITQSTIVRGIVIRASLLYGRGGSLLAPWFKGAYEGTIAWPGTPGGRYATVHVDDLAECYRLAVEKAPLVTGLVLDASNSVSEPVDTLIQQLGIVAGVPKEKIGYLAPQNLYEKALSSTSILRPSLARDLLGWVPKKASLIDGIATYYAAFLADSGLIN